MRSPSESLSIVNLFGNALVKSFTWRFAFMSWQISRSRVAREGVSPSVSTDKTLVIGGQININLISPRSESDWSVFQVDIGVFQEGERVIKSGSNRGQIESNRSPESQIRVWRVFSSMCFLTFCVHRDGPELPLYNIKRLEMGGLGAGWPFAQPLV